MPVRKLASLVTICALLVLAVAALPTAAAARRDKDCDNFASQRAAQIFFLKHGGPRSDPDRLDADHDGIACEDNPAPYDFQKHL